MLLRLLIALGLLLPSPLLLAQTAPSRPAPPRPTRPNAPTTITTQGNTLRSGPWQLTLRGLGSAGRRYNVRWDNYTASGNWVIATIDLRNTSKTTIRSEDYANFLAGLQLVGQDRKFYAVSEAVFPDRSGPFAPGEVRQFRLLFDVPNIKPAHLTFRDLTSGKIHNLFNRP